MANPVTAGTRTGWTGGWAGSRLVQISVLAVTLSGGGYMMLPGLPAMIMLGAGLGLVFTAAILIGFSRLGALTSLRRIRAVSSYADRDQAPTFVTNRDGMVVYANPAALERGGECVNHPLAQAFRDVFANPAAVLFRLQNRAQAQLSAREDVSTRKGHVRLSVHPLSQDVYLWRLEDFGERATNSRGAEGLSLPMLTASGSGTVLFMNEAMRKVLGGRIKSVDRIFPNMPVRPGERQEILGRDGPVQTHVAEIEGPGGRREIYFVPGIKSDTVPTQTPSFSELPVPLLSISSGGKIEEANQLARQLLNMPETGEFTVSDVVEGLGRSVRDWIDGSLAGKHVQRSEVIRARRTEEEVFLQITLEPIVQGDRRLLLGVLADATELKTLEAQFVQSQKMQAIGQLAGGVAHDFNNLLTAISGHCDLLLTRHDSGDQDYSDLMQINENSNRAASLVGQLLAFSRKQNLQPEVIDLREALSELTHLLNRLVGGNVSLNLTHDPALLPMRADKRQLEQVLMNLVVNARDAMPDGGEIQIETLMKKIDAPLRRDRAEVPAGEYVCIRVADQGCGIPPDRLPKVFEPFYTTKRAGEGTGLGLSMAYGIVKQSGGFIFADSIVGSGTTFSLYFPSFNAPVAEISSEETITAQLSKDTEAARSGGVVLLVEDEIPVRAFASRALRMRGYTVLEAESAEEALKTLEDPDLQIDLFVTDVVMPGMDGPTWVRQALKERPGVRVIFVSGYAEDAFEDTQDKIPNSTFLPKPFSLTELTSEVSRSLN